MVGMKPEAEQRVFQDVEIFRDRLMVHTDVFRYFRIVDEFSVHLGGDLEEPPERQDISNVLLDLDFFPDVGSGVGLQKSCFFRAGPGLRAFRTEREIDFGEQTELKSLFEVEAVSQLPVGERIKPVRE